MSDSLIGRLLEVSTLRDLRGSTLKELAEQHGVGRITVWRYRRWCSNCYQEDRGTDHGPYDRLLWSIDLVSACPEHRTLLASRCLSCGSGNFPVLIGRDCSGFCPKCHHWLGDFKSSVLSQEFEYSRYLLWIARSFASLLDDAVPARADVGTNVVGMIERICARHFDGKMSHLARAIGGSKSMVSMWASNSAPPGWLSLCNLSYCFQIPLRDLLVGGTDSVEMSQVVPLPTEARKTPRIRPRKWDVAQLRLFLSAVERGDHPSLLTFKAVAVKLGIDVKQLRSFLPAESKSLAALLGERREVIRIRKQVLVKQAVDTALRAIARSLSQENVKPTRREIGRRLALLGIQVRRHSAVEYRLTVIAEMDQIVGSRAKAEHIRLPGSR